MQDIVIIKQVKVARAEILTSSKSEILKMEIKSFPNFQARKIKFKMVQIDYIYFQFETIKYNKSQAQRTAIWNFHKNWKTQHQKFRKLRKIFPNFQTFKTDALRIRITVRILTTWIFSISRVSRNVAKYNYSQSRPEISPSLKVLRTVY